MMRVLVLFFLAVVFSAHAAQDISIAPMQFSERAENAEAGISIGVIPGWKRSSVYQQALLVMMEPRTDKDDTFPENLSIGWDDLSKAGTVTLEKYFAESKKIISQALKQVKESDSGDTLINGVAARWWRYTHMMKAGELMVQQFFMVKNQKGYVLTYTSKAEDFARYQEVFESNAASFVVK